MDTKEINTPVNSTFAISGFSCFADSLVVKGSSVLPHHALWHTEHTVRIELRNEFCYEL